MVFQLNNKRGVVFMSYEVFKSKINALIDKAGGGIKVQFSTDQGIHHARCSDGTTIIGNEECLRVSVHWGSGHNGLATI